MAHISYPTLPSAVSSPWQPYGYQYGSEFWRHPPGFVDSSASEIWFGQRHVDSSKTKKQFLKRQRHHWGWNELMLEVGQGSGAKWEFCEVTVVHLQVSQFLLMLCSIVSFLMVVLGFQSPSVSLQILISYCILSSFDITPSFPSSIEVPPAWPAVTSHICSYCVLADFSSKFSSITRPVLSIFHIIPALYIHLFMSSHGFFSSFFFHTD